jgi:hypothetical protein
MVNIMNKSTNRFRASEQQAYDELQCYTLGHSDPGFIHQHVVDAWAAQHADERTKPIGRLRNCCSSSISYELASRILIHIASCQRDWP